MRPSFSERVTERSRAASSLLCVGLDPDPARLPPALLREHGIAEATERFLAAIIEATAPHALAFKPNWAFFEALGADMWPVLTRTLARIPEGVLVVADAKRGDIGNTARFYAKLFFEELRCDSCTISPYMGEDCVRPFLAYEGRAAFVLARTSNAGAKNLQETVCDGMPLYLRVALLVEQWGADSPGEAGLVVGATAPDALVELRANCPTLPFLIPGLGAQGGDVDAVLGATLTPNGPVLINSSRAILYAGESEGETLGVYAAAAADAAEAMKQRLGTART